MPLDKGHRRTHYQEIEARSNMQNTNASKINGTVDKEWEREDGNSSSPKVIWDFKNIISIPRHNISKYLFSP